MAVGFSSEWRSSLSSVEMVVFLPPLAMVLYLLTTPYYYLAPLPALALPFLILLDKRTQLGLYLIISLVPFSQYIGLSEQFGFVTIPKVIGLAMALVIAVQLLSGSRSAHRLGSNLWPWMLLFLAACLLAGMYAEFPERAFDSIRRLFNGYILFAFVLLLVGAEALRGRLDRVITLSVAASALLSILGYVFEIPLFAMNLEAESLKRAVGAANDPNFFAAMLIFGLPLLAHRFFTSAGGAGRLAVAVLFLLSLISVALTHSRSGALALGAVLLLLTVAHLPRLRPRYLGVLVLGGLAFVAVAAVMVPQTFVERMQTMTQTAEDRSIGRRVSYLHVGWESFRENPVLGVGLGGFKEVYAKSDQARRFERVGKTNKRSAHNTYIELAVGTGVVGLLAFAALTLAAWRNFRGARRTLLARGEDELASLAQAYQLSFLSVLIFFFFLSALYLEYFWLSLAVSQLLRNLARD